MNNPDSKKTGFNKLELHAELLSNLDDLDFHTMTPIQALSLPKILDGQDVIAQAKTGSGKTAAFGLGILNKLDVKKFNLVDDQKLVFDLLKSEKILIVHGTAFNWPEP